TSNSPVAALPTLKFPVEVNCEPESLIVSEPEPPLESPRLTNAPLAAAPPETVIAPTADDPRTMLPAFVAIDEPIPVTATVPLDPERLPTSRFCVPVYRPPPVIVIVPTPLFPTAVTLGPASKIASAPIVKNPVAASTSPIDISPVSFPLRIVSRPVCAA